MRGTSDTSVLKERIQVLLREVAIARDRGCVLKNISSCNGHDKDGQLVLQADHLIERSNSSTYADSRLVVCVCKGHHGWKHFTKSNHDQYNQLIREIISKDRIKLWEECEKNSWKPVRTGAYDWKMAIIALKQELKEYEEKENTD
jgi:hypothetical protein